MTLSEAQAFVRIETGEEEAVLAGLMRSASAICEAFLNQVVMARDFSGRLPASGSWARLAADPGAVDHGGRSWSMPTEAASALPASRLMRSTSTRSGDGWVRLIAAPVNVAACG